MADVRSLLKNERAARRITHKYASYSPTGTLLCIVCHLQLKSESLWDGHLRSAGHLMKLQKQQVKEQDSTPEPAPAIDGNKKKRKASEGEEAIRKRSRAANGLPEGFFDPGAEPQPEAPPAQPTTEIRIPSRPATPAKAMEAAQKQPDVDEDEWAAFEADIAAAEAPAAEDVVISAPAMSAADLAAKSLEETNAQRKEREEAELEGDKEDAARKLEDEFEEMEGLEHRVRKMREKREALRAKESMVDLREPTKSVDPVDEDDDDEEDDDDWDGFRMR